MSASNSSDRYRLIETLYQRALDLPDHERSAFLTRECRGDADLLGELYALIDHYHRSARNGFLSGSAHALAANGAASAPLPEQIGPYRISGTLGRGGMGVIYAAEQLRPRRCVALKVLRSDALSDEALARLELEADALGRLRHPAVASVYEFGVGDVRYGGVCTYRQPYFAMELVQGVPLGEFAARPGTTRDRLLELFGVVCDAVQHAHQNGVIHRDLKPANILVTEDGQPKVLDFGVARLARPERQSLGSITAAHGVIGTLAYMSPEQAAGDRHVVDTRSDVYSLGVILYELLARRLPVECRDRPIPEAVRAICETDPPPLGTIDPALRGDLETIVRKALERDPERRFASAAEFAAEIRRFLRREPILTRSGNRWYLVRKLIARHKLAVSVAGAFLTLVLASAVSVAFLYDAQLRQSYLAHQAQMRAEQKAAQAAAVLAVFQDVLRSPDPEQAHGPDVTVREMLDEVSSQIGKFRDQPEVEAAVRATLGETYLTLGLYDHARPHLVEALETRIRFLGEQHGEVVALQILLADLHHACSEFNAARMLYRRGLETRRQLLGDTHPDVSDLLVRLAIIDREDGHLAEAEKLCREALRNYRASGGKSAAGIADCLIELGYIARTANRLTEAEEHLRAALAQNRAHFGEIHPKVYLSMKSLAALLRIMNRYDEAEALYAQALDGVRATLGADHPHVANVLNSIANLRHRQGRFDESEAAFREAIDIYRKRHAGDRESIAVCLSNYGHMLATKGEPDRAAALTIEALEIRRRIHDEGHHDVWANLRSASRYLLAAGDARAAFELLRDGVDRARGLTDKQTAVLVPRLLELGSALLSHARISKDGTRWFPEAEAALTEAYAILSENPGVAHAQTRQVARLIADHLLEQQRFEEAERWLTADYEAMLKSAGSSSTNVWEAWARLTTLYGLWGDHSERLIAPLQQLLDSNAPAEVLDVWAWNIAAHPSLATSVYEAGLEALRRADQLTPGNVQILKSIGMTYFRLGRFDTALDYMQRADALRRAQIPGGIPEDVAFIAMSLHALGRASEAREAFDRMCVLLEDQRTDHPVAPRFRAEAERFLALSPSR